MLPLWLLGLMKLGQTSELLCFSRPAGGRQISKWVIRRKTKVDYCEWVVVVVDPTAYN